MKMQPPEPPPLQPASGQPQKQEAPSHKTGFAFRAPQPGETNELYQHRVSKAKARHSKSSGQGRAIGKMLAKKKVRDSDSDYA